MRLRSQAFISILLAGAMLPVPVAAEPSGEMAMMTSKGTVTVNGAAAAASTALMKGDKVRSGVNSAASIMAPGLTALVEADTELSFQGKALQLNDGAITVSTEKAVPVQVGSLLVTPAVPGSNRYEVRHRNCQSLVLARAGSVTLSDGTTVKQGQVARRDDQLCMAALPQTQGGGPPPAAGSGGASSGLSKAAVYGIGAGAAGAAAAVAILTVNHDHPVSPSRP